MFSKIEKKPLTELISLRGKRALITGSASARYGGIAPERSDRERLPDGGYCSITFKKGSQITPRWSDP